MRGPRAWTVVGPGAIEPGARAGAGAVRVEEPASLEEMLPALLGDMLPALLLGSLSPREPTNLGDVHLGVEQQGRFFWGAIARGTQLFDWLVD